MVVDTTYFLVWQSYNGTEVERFPKTGHTPAGHTARERLEKRITELMEVAEEDGVSILLVAKGRELKYEFTQIKTVYKVRE